MEKRFTFDYEISVGSTFKREGRRYKVNNCIEDIDYDGMWHCQCEDVTSDAEIKEYEDYLREKAERNEKISYLKNQIQLLASSRTLDIYDFVDTILADETTEIIPMFHNTGKHLCSFGEYPSPDHVTFYEDGDIYMVYCKDSNITFYKFNDKNHAQELNKYIEERSEFITSYNIFEDEIRELNKR